MKFYINQKVLDNHLAIVSKGVSSKNIQPILSGIYLEAREDNTLILRGTDMEIGIEAIVDAVVEEPGKIVIPSKYFVEMVRKLPGIDIYFEQSGEGQIKIKYGHSELNLNFLSGDDYPSLMDFKGDHEFKIKGKDLLSGISLAGVAISTDTSRPIFTGVLMEISGNKINFVSSDTHRLAFVSEAISGSVEGSVEAIIPGKSLKEVTGIASEDDEVDIEVSNNRILFKNKNKKILSRLIEGKFVNYSQVIPKEFKSNFNVLRKSFLETLERAFLLTRDESKSKLNTVKISVEPTKMIISCKATEIGDSYEEISIFLDGDDMELGFNAKYLIEMLRALKTEEISFRLTGPQSASIIKPVEEDEKNENPEDTLFLILPVRLQ